MTADPHVTRMANPRRSAYQYQHFADDESSDSASAPGFSDGFGIQGTFPSTECIRVRWAPPVRNIENGTHAGRRRVGVSDVRGEMLCTITGRGRDKITGIEGVLVHLDYKGTCQGIWYPGVATLLGLDVGLEATGCDVSWANDKDYGWDVVGGAGYTGHEIDGAEQPHTGKQTSFDMPTMTIPTNLLTPATPNGHTSRQSSTSSTSSLLRAPLPPQNVPEYSFESSPTTPGSEAGLSSVFYTTTESETREPTRSPSIMQSESDAPLPSLPITLHLNINDFLPPNKNAFTFSIKGVVLVTPRAPSSSAAGDKSPDSSDTEGESRELLISLPRFRILAADSEQIETAVRNNIDSPTDVVDVCPSSDPNGRRAEIARGARTRVSSRGGFVTVRPLRVRLPRTPVSTQSATRREGIGRPTPTDHQRTPGSHRVASSAALRESLHTALKPIRDGPFIIPHIHATVTPLSTEGASIPRAYAVCVRLPAPADAADEWLDFGLGHVPSPQSTEKGLAGPVRAQIVSASVDGVPVKFETNTIAKPPLSGGSALVFEQMSGKEWETWVRVHVGSSCGGPVEITYIVNEHNDRGKKGKGKERETTGSGLDVILPAFSIPVGRLQVDIENPSGTSWVKSCPGNESKILIPLSLSLGFEITSVQSNLEHQHTRGDHRRLRQFGLREFFYSQIRVHIAPQARPHSPGGVPLPWPTSSKSTAIFLRGTMAHAAPAVLSLILLVLVLGMYNDLNRLRTSLIDRCGPPPGPNWANAPVPSVTVTATVVSHHHHPMSTATGTHADSDSDVEWDDSDWASPRSDDSAASGRSAPPTFVTMIDVSSPPPSANHEHERERARPPSSGGDASAHGEHNALIPIEHFPLLWPIKFELPFTREQALEAIEHGLSVTWQILRRLYHFPLDPP